MGISIGNQTDSISVGYGGFHRLRCDIAGVFGEDFQTLYKNWRDDTCSNKEISAALKVMYDKGELTDKDDPVIKFLFSCDCDGELSYQGCKRLYQLIEDYGNDNEQYGYIGRLDDCATLADFKEIVKDCSANHWMMEWD